VTLSEPLGIVSMESWADFPQYDCPGLFSDNAQRSGMHLSHWRAEGYERAYSIPFDEQAQQRCIERLGAVIGEYLSRHSDHRIVSFVDDDAGKTTHGAMLDHAMASGVSVERHCKRATARVSPLDHMRTCLS
jgi:hypothetical protein